jgi:hypothetical protein
MYCRWRSNYQEGRGVIDPRHMSYACARPKHFCVVQSLVDIGGIVKHRCNLFCVILFAFHIIPQL